MKTFIFDMDGVLLDSESIFVSSLQSYLKDQGIRDEVPVEVLAQFTGMKTDLISERLIETFHLKQTAAEISADQDRYFDAEVRRRGHLTPMEGLKSFLTALKKNGFQTALATSSDRVWVRYVLDELGVADCFDQVVTGEEVAVSKPAPDIFLLAAKRTSSLPKECVVIEDSMNGIRAGKAAGMFVIGYKGSEIWQDTSQADEEVNSFAEISLSKFTTV